MLLGKKYGCVKRLKGYCRMKFWVDLRRDSGRQFGNGFQASSNDTAATYAMEVWLKQESWHVRKQILLWKRCLVRDGPDSSSPTSWCCWKCGSVRSWNHDPADALYPCLQSDLGTRAPGFLECAGRRSPAGAWVSCTRFDPGPKRSRDSS